MNRFAGFRVKQFLLLAAALWLVACGRAPGPGPEATPQATAEAQEATPRPTAVSRAGTTILAEGSLVAVEPQLPLAFATSGRLLDLRVRAGDRVEAGDLVAMLDDEALQDAVANGRLGVRQAENSLAQAQLSLDQFLNWTPDETAVAQAEAALAAAEANLENAQSQDSAAAYNLTSARVSLEQAERALGEVQDAYETAFDPGRDWEQFIDDPSCLTGQQYPNCTGPPYSDVIKNEREAAERAVPRAEEQLQVAQANYNLALAGLNDNSAVSAEANIAGARQTLDQALRGPSADEIAAARLQVEQAGLSLEQAQATLANAEGALEDARLIAPASGTVMAVNNTPGSFVGTGTAVVTLLNTDDLQFHTTNLSERDLAQIAPGQPVAIVLKAYPNDSINGRVERIIPLAEGNIGDAATFTVVVALGDSDLDLLPGMTGRVEISGQS